MKQQELKQDIYIQNIHCVYILKYMNTISIANQPVHLFTDENNKEVRLNNFALKDYKLKD